MASFTFSPLTPTAFLTRSAAVFPDRTAVVDGDRRFTYREFEQRSQRLAGALAASGVEPGDRVAALCANSSAMLELHHGVPGAGAVLVPLNNRLDATEPVEEARAVFEPRWVRWNVVRTVLCVASFVALVPALS